MISAGLPYKEKGHNSQSIPDLTSLCLSLPKPQLGLTPPPTTTWAIFECVRAALRLCCYYCDSMFFQNGISKQPRPKLPWNEDGELNKCKQRDLPRTTLIFNSRNRDIKTFS